MYWESTLEKEVHGTDPDGRYVKTYGRQGDGLETDNMASPRANCASLI